MNNWEKLCDLLEPSLSTKSVTEELFHKYFVKALKDIFNWAKPNLKEEVPVRMGSRDKYADIVLEGDDFGIVIEMKRPEISLGTDQIKQLVSYMHDLEDSKYKYGFLVGNMITVLYYDRKSERKPEEVVRFSFDSNNQDGIALGEILDKKVCSDEKLKEYVTKMIARKRKEEEAAIKEEKRKKLKKDLLENNGKMIKDMLKERLASAEYTEEMIADILNDIEIRETGVKAIDNEPIPPGNTEFSERCIIIKIKLENVMKKNGSYDENVYETVRRCWNNKITRAEQADYVLAVIAGKICGVYKPTKWYYPKDSECMNCPTDTTNKPCGRIAFEGEKASEDMQKKYLGNDIPHEYKKQGMASPVLFTF